MQCLSATDRAMVLGQRDPTNAQLTDPILSKHPRELRQVPPVHSSTAPFRSVGIPVLVRDVRQFGDGVEQVDQTFREFLVAT